MNKKLLFCLNSVLISVIFLAVASAQNLVLTKVSQPSSMNHNQGSFTITFNLTNQDLTNSANNLIFFLESSEASLLSISPLISSVANGTTTTFTATIGFTAHQSGTLDFILKVNGTINGVSETASLSYNIPIINSYSLEIFDVGNILESNRETTFKIKNNGNMPLSIQQININRLEYKTGKFMEFSVNETVFSLSPQNVKTIKISTTIPSDLDLGDYSTIINVIATETNKTAELKVLKTFCEFGQNGTDLEITNIKDKSSEDEWEWKPLDEVEIEVKVENNKNKEKDVVVEIQLYDPANKEFVDLDNNEIDLTIDEDDSEVAVFNIEVPSDIDEGDYRLYVKAYEDGAEDEQCTDKIDGDSFKTVSVEKESRDVRVKKVEFSEKAVCGESIDVRAKVYNIGNDDEDKVKVNIYNKELGLNLDSERFSLDKGDSKTVVFNVKIPQNAAQKTYGIDFTPYFDYRKSSDDFRKSSSSFTQELEIGCVQVKQSILITASLDSEAKAGEEIVIKAIVKNTGDVKTDYTMSILNYESWSELKSVEPSLISLNPGESRDVVITFKANNDAIGEKLFKIRASYNGKTTDQEAAINIEKAGFGITGQAVKDIFAGNKMLAVIALLNIILVIAIIIVAVRVARAK